MSNDMTPLEIRVKNAQLALEGIAIAFATDPDAITPAGWTRDMLHTALMIATGHMSGKGQETDSASESLDRVEYFIQQIRGGAR